MSKEYHTNPLAESIGSAVAIVIFTLSVISALILIVFGIASMSMDEKMGIAAIAISLVVLISGVISWAALKIIVNISRNLFNINEALRSHPTLASPQAQPNPPAANARKAQGTQKSKFEIGDIVTVKKDKHQIKIIDVVVSDDKTLYYGDSDTCYFFEDELE